ncbi:hypothetical protein ACLMAL_04690 [Nocardia sp. CWNU-33]
MREFPRDAIEARNPRRWWILIVLRLSMLVLVIDNFTSEGPL